jgi:glutaryl-CoA dehydrogenase
LQPKKQNHVSTTPEINKTDLFQSHDYYAIDELLSEDHLLAREAVRAWVKQEVSPIIEDYANRAECPTHLFKGLGEIGAFDQAFQQNTVVAVWMR